MGMMNTQYTKHENEELPHRSDTGLEYIGRKSHQNAKSINNTTVSTWPEGAVVVKWANIERPFSAKTPERKHT